MAEANVTLAEILAKLEIPVNARGNADCPFCQRKQKLHFDFRTNLWRCPSCGASGGVLHLYARYQLGMESLPSGKAERKKIALELIKFMGYDHPDIRKSRPAPIKREPDTPPAFDAYLGKVYEAMANLPCFALSQKHKEALLRRGLSESDIERNGYRTFPYQLPPISKEIETLFNSVTPSLREGITEKKARKIKFGMMVSHELEKAGFSLKGVPGFYQFGGNWCIYFLPGMLIPTRNLSGQIVSWQVRRDFGDAKYITLSCSGLPGAVNTGVSRCHFPLGNAPLNDPNVRVIFTEGPLKADVALALSAGQTAFAAIPGVNNTKDLLRNLSKLRKAGLKTVFNGLDMDRLTNNNVREPSAALTKKIAEMGIQVIPMYWGEGYARLRLMMETTIANAKGVPIPTPEYPVSVFERLDMVSLALHKAGIAPLKTLPKNIRHWEAETKGIDDYLMSLRQK